MSSTIPLYYLRLNLDYQDYVDLYARFDRDSLHLEELVTVGSFETPFQKLIFTYDDATNVQHIKIFNANQVIDVSSENLYLEYVEGYLFYNEDNFATFSPSSSSSSSSSSNSSSSSSRSSSSFSGSLSSSSSSSSNSSSSSSSSSFSSSSSSSSSSSISGDVRILENSDPRVIEDGDVRILE
jgi:hypothetical protein